MVIGQGCLSVELNAAERKRVGRGTDAIFFIFMVPECVEIKQRLGCTILHEGAL